ncbi:unnamed protein product [Auanema sp. JU1783]|nr:unnamed protein product [Auanema sp. JU1783]
MSSERRRSSLMRIHLRLDKELTKLYSQGRADVMATNTKQITLVEFIEYLQYKVNEALGSLDGGQIRGSHRLSRFQQKLKDKSGIPLTVLTMPLSGEDRSLPPPSATPSIHSNYAPSSFRSDDYEEYDKISDEGFCSSSTRPATIIDEPANPSLCRALYDFDPKHDDEITIRAGQVVIVEDRIGTDWLIGYVMGSEGRASKSGRFPTSYVVF